MSTMMPPVATAWNTASSYRAGPAVEDRVRPWSAFRPRVDDDLFHAGESLGRGPSGRRGREPIAERRRPAERGRVAGPGRAGAGRLVQLEH